MVLGLVFDRSFDFVKRTYFLNRDILQAKFVASAIYGPNLADSLGGLGHARIRKGNLQHTAFMV